MFAHHDNIVSSCGDFRYVVAHPWCMETDETLTSLLSVSTTI